MNKINNNNNNNKIVIRSALGYWSNVLKNIFPGNDIHITDWDIEIESFDNSIDNFNKDICPELDDNNKIKSLSEHSAEEHLYVFIAPITWASRYQRVGFTVIGPAFGTKDSISIFAGTYPYESNNPELATIGTIGKYITSTALFEVYNNYITKIFNRNIHLLAKAADNADDIEIEAKNFNFISEPNEAIRFYHLKKDSNENKSANNTDFAIFTIKDVDELELNNRKDVKEAVKIEPILSHIYNTPYIPRTVYCIHKSQLKKNMKEQLKKFNKLLMAYGPKYDKAINGTNAYIYPIDPENKEMQKIQNRVIKVFRNILFNRDKTINYKEIFKCLKFEELVSLIENIQ